MKAGNKVRIIAGSPNQLYRQTGIKLEKKRQYQIGDVLQLVNEAHTKSPVSYLYFDNKITEYLSFFASIGALKNDDDEPYFRIRSEFVELISDKRQVCTCPLPALMSQGCTCGGT